MARADVWNRACCCEWRTSLVSRTKVQSLTIDCEQKEDGMEAALIKESNRVASSTANSVECRDETLVAEFLTALK